MCLSMAVVAEEMRWWQALNQKQQDYIIINEMLAQNLTVKKVVQTLM